MQPGDHLGIDDLPAYTFRQAEESAMMPCAEVYLTESLSLLYCKQGVVCCSWLAIIWRRLLWLDIGAGM